MTVNEYKNLDFIMMDSYCYKMNGFKDYLLTVGIRVIKENHQEITIHNMTYEKLLYSRCKRGIAITPNKKIADQVMNDPNLYQRISVYFFDEQSRDIKPYPHITKRSKFLPANNQPKWGRMPNPFMICHSVTLMNDEKTPVGNIPSNGDTVFTQNNTSVTIKDKIGAGGEGTTYYTDRPNIVAKIYSAGANSRLKIEKLKLMTSRKIQFEGICYPTDLLFDGSGHFVGYLMPIAKGVPIQRLFIRDVLSKQFPNWKKRDIVELCLTILEKIDYLHRWNIILGDINPLNILVASSKEIYLVDTDSYQVEGFPCPVGTVDFTPAELQGKSYKNLLRTKGNENFAIAVLLFMILMLGKHPYTHKNGSDPKKNIEESIFPFTFTDNSASVSCGNQNAPAGDWRYLWSHMPYKIKKAFWNTFHRDGQYHSEKLRPTVGVWMDLLKEYLYLLDSGKYGKQDKMSEELFPVRFKRNPNDGIEYSLCPECQQYMDRNSFFGGCCNVCNNRKVERQMNIQRQTRMRTPLKSSGNFSQQHQTLQQMAVSKFKSFLKKHNPFS